MGIGKRTLWASLGLTPVVLVLKYTVHPSDVVMFVVAAAALVPLAWLIGEATEHVAEHTGPGIGGFLNASFGNAPELIIAVLAIQKGLFDVVRGSITGSVVSNLLLVLGLTMIAGAGELDRRSLLTQLGTIGVAVAAFLVPSIPGWSGDRNRHELFVVSIPVALFLLAVYLVTAIRGLRRHGAMETPEASHSAWSLRTSVTVLAVAAVATAFVSEALVSSLEGFGHALGLSEFFIAAVIVAIVGNAAEHGGAIVVSRRGRTKLASEIAISSAAQVAVFVAPAAALVSIAGSHDLTLAFRPVEIATMALAALAVAFVVFDGRSTRREGIALAIAYGGAVAAYALAG